MSQTPLGEEQLGAGGELGELGEQRQVYQDGWTALSRMARRGFSWSGRERNCAFLNLGSAGFADVSALSGFDFDDDGRSLAVVDWDLDGDMDLIVGNRNGPRVRFLENRSAALGKTIELLSEGGNSAAIGARVELFLSGQSAPLVRSVRAGEGYLAQSSSRLNFGLAGSSVERAVVHWPAGPVEEFVGDFGPTALQLVRGSGVPQVLKAGVSSAGFKLEDLSEAAREARAPKAGRRVVLTQPVPLPSMEILSPGGESVSLFGILPGGKARGTGRPILLHIWASWCAPCIQEFKAFKDQQAELEASGIACLALSADEDPAAAVKIMEGLEWPWQWGFVPSLSLDVLDAIQAALLDSYTPMPLPTSFLVDREGMLRVIYLGPLDMQQLLRDKRLLELSPAGLREASVPFPGLWRSAVVERDIGVLENKLLRRGLDTAANEYARAGYNVLQKSSAEMLYGFARQSSSRGDRSTTIRYLRQAVVEDPAFLLAQFELGSLLHQRGELHAAISAYLAAIAADESHRGSHYNLCLAYLGTGQMRSAGKQLEWIEEHHPEMADGLQKAVSEEQAKRAGEQPEQQR